MHDSFIQTQSHVGILQRLKCISMWNTHVNVCASHSLAHRRCTYRLLMVAGCQGVPHNTCTHLSSNHHKNGSYFTHKWMKRKKNHRRVFFNWFFRAFNFICGLKWLLFFLKNGEFYYKLLTCSVSMFDLIGGIVRFTLFVRFIDAFGMWIRNFCTFTIQIITIFTT